MSLPVSDMDRDVFLGFLDESLDGLTDAENAVVRLESDPQNSDIINTIFRSAHSLKGNSAFFGLMKLKTLAHRLEDLLDAVRQKRLRASRRVIDVLLPGLDMLRRMLENVRDDRPECEDLAALEIILADIQKILDVGDAVLPTLTEIVRSLKAVRDRLPAEFRSLLDESIRLATHADMSDHSLETSGPSTGTGPSDRHPLAILLESPFEDVATENQVLEIRNALDEGVQAARTSRETDILSQAREILETFSGCSIGFDNRAREMMRDLVAQLPSPPEPTLAPDRIPGEKQSASAEKPKDEKRRSDSAKTLRIAESSLDDFLDHVGELIGIEERLRYCLRKTGDPAAYSELKQVVEQFCKVSSELRNGVMDIRKVQGRIILDKVPRLVRDVASRSGKQINIDCVGGDLRIDKNYAELLDAPLVHMVRNAADHGIEMPSDREMAEKPPEGNIRIELSEQENHIRLTISDDGKGLNYEALSHKAVEMGLIEQERALSKEEVIRLLFMSGVSTAAEITDVSGRGVGMDVVKQAVDSAGGQIRVDSTPGQGTVFTILLPKNVSTKIIDGYLVRSRNGGIFVLPLDVVLEAFVAEPSAISTISQQGRMVIRRNALHPVIDLSTLVDGMGTDIHTGSGRRSSHETFVLLDIDKKTFVLAVDEIIGVQKAVIKPICGIHQKDSMIEGAAIMGDGTVALILSDQCFFQMREYRS